jgi:diadenosine tetraphosphatase ApaH/serine/threonine PP2A family protein phosphatase
MRAAILSDIHANMEALEAVEARLAGLRVDRVYFLGDAVGYNADPSYCLGRIAALAELSVRGNHDKTVADPGNLDWFNEVARKALVWTRRELGERDLRLLEGLPSGPLAAGERWVICHGSPLDEDQYLTQARDAQEAFRFLASAFPRVQAAFFGHTHVPLVVPEKGRAAAPPDRFSLREGVRYLINPGSVGQPRDRNPLASFGVLDEGEQVYEHYRVPYPIEKTQAKILAAGLPRALADRLAGGW